MADDPDPKGVAEPPDTAPMQAMNDRLRGLMVGEHPLEVRDATIMAASEMMELQTDWLVDQHKLILRQCGVIDQQNEVIKELTAFLGKDLSE